MTSIYIILENEVSCEHFKVEMKLRKIVGRCHKMTFLTYCDDGPAYKGLSGEMHTSPI